MNKWFVSLNEWREKNNRYEQRWKVEQLCLWHYEKAQSRKSRSSSTCSFYTFFSFSSQILLLTNEKHWEKKKRQKTNSTSSKNFVLTHAHTIHRNSVFGNCFVYRAFERYNSRFDTECDWWNFQWIHSSLRLFQPSSVFVHKTYAYIRNADIRHCELAQRIREKSPYPKQ